MNHLPLVFHWLSGSLVGVEQLGHEPAACPLLASGGGPDFIHFCILEMVFMAFKQCIKISQTSYHLVFIRTKVFQSISSPL